MARVFPLRMLAVAGLAFANLAFMTLTSVTAREEIPAETREYSYSAILPGCDAPEVLSRIQSRFSRTERRFWSSEAEILAVDGVKQVAFRPHGIDIIPRRYCRATAIMADRSRRKLHYAIIEDAGFAGMGNDVQFCLEGYDRKHTAPPGCARLDR